MEMKPGYKQTEVGVIPDNWEVKTLDSVAFVTSGKRLPVGHSLTEHETPHPYIRVTDMRPGTVSLADVKFVQADVFPVIQRYRIFKEDIFISVAGTLGIVGKIPPELDGANLTENADRITKITCSQDYLLHVLMSPLIQNTIDSLQTVGAQPKLALTRIRKFVISLPSTKAEQEVIAEFLSDADALIESLEQLIAKKRHLKQGAMQELLTGKKRLPGFSGEWELKRLGDVTDTDPENLRCDTRVDFAFKYIALDGVDMGTLRSYAELVFRSAPSRARRKLRRHDILVSTVRPNLMSHLLFRVEGENWVCSTGFCVVRCREGVAHPGYVYFHMFAGYIARQIEALLTGSNYPAINSGDVRALEVPFPEYSEQSAIAAILSDMDAEIAALEGKLAKARQIKQGMMQELLTGRIRLV